MEYTPEIPLWVQLPVFKQEGMMTQFLPGMPGLAVENDKTFINTSGETFEKDVVKFYEDYLAVTDGGATLSESRFALTPDTAKGFFELMKLLKTLPQPPVAVKGQITGPFTFGTGVVDQNGRAIFYNEQLKDIAVKLVAMKAGWQVRQLSQFGCPVILFFDEPGLTGFGSSVFISISKEEVETCLQEAIETVHAEGGLAGVHICANAEWSLLLESSVDIVSFDAYSFFDKFMLYPDQIKKFIRRGGILAWGIVPTSNAEDVKKETADSLISKWKHQAAQIEALGIDRAQLKAQTLITPSCGTGSLSLDSATRVLKLTREVSKRIRETN
jgi:methionine synthase II (cobalamin-independent)